MCFLCVFFVIIYANFLPKRQFAGTFEMNEMSEVFFWKKKKKKKKWSVPTIILTYPWCVMQIIFTGSIIVGVCEKYFMYN